MLIELIREYCDKWRYYVILEIFQAKHLEN